MAFTNTEKDLLRTYMGFPKLWSQANSVFETIMDTIDGINDGGATEASIRAILTKLAAIETKLDVNSNLMLAHEVTDEVKYDGGRNAMLLRSEGRKLIQQLSIRFSIRAGKDYFGNVQVHDYGFNSMMLDI